MYCRPGEEAGIVSVGSIRFDLDEKMSLPLSGDSKFLEAQPILERSPARAKALAMPLMVCALFFAAVVGLQWWGGAFRAEFSGHPDESSHYVTGLMVRDYLAALMPEAPMRFAENYYLHYPKVAFGHWPPVFYLLQSGWTLLFSPSRLSLILLMALLTTLFAYTLYRVARAQFGARAGIVAGLALIALPLTQTYSGMVMAELPLALFCFWATLCFGRFLERERWQDAVGFGLLAALAILTKGNGLVLGLVPLFALLFSRRFHLLKRPALWLAALIVFVLCAPWQYLTLRMASNGMGYEPGWDYTSQALPYNLQALAQVVGWTLLVLVMIGFAARIIVPWRQRAVTAPWAAAGALLLSVLVFHSLVPASLESRFLLVAAPPLVLFAAAGIAWLVQRLSFGGLSVRRRAEALVLVVALLFVAETFAVPRNPQRGFVEAAQSLLAQPQLRNSALLISSDETGEGAFIAEVAMREQRPAHFVLRASKVVAKSDWAGGSYELLYQTPAELMQYLEELPVGILVIDTSPAGNRRPHHHLLRETVRAYSHRWELLGSYAGEDPSAGALQAYRLIGHENRPMGRIRIDMDYMLNRILEK